MAVLTMLHWESAVALFAVDLTSMQQMALFFLFPMIPAFVFFQLVRSVSSATVTGNVPDPTGIMKNIKFQVGGAFGAYFLTVLTVLSTHNIWNPPAIVPQSPPTAEVWHVTGDLTDDQGNPIFPYDMKDVSLYPSPLTPDPRGHFDFMYAVPPSDHNKKIYPTISFAYQAKSPHGKVDLTAPSISLDPNDPQAPKLTWGQANRVDVGRIILKPIGRWNPQGQAVNLAAAQNLQTNGELQ